MSLKVGSTTIGSLYLGSARISAVYLGSVLVYPAQEPPAPPADLDVRHLALIAGDYPIVGTPSDAEEARHRALISE